MKDPDVVKLSYDNFVFKFGKAIIGTDKQVIWDGALPAYNCLDETSDELFSVVSTSANDKVGGGGATHIKFNYQDLAGIEHWSEEVALNGLTPVDIPLITGVIAYRMKVTQTEDNSILTGPNHGIIKLYQTGTATKIYAEISATEGQTLMCIYRIPANKYAEVKSLFLNAGSGKEATLWMRIRKDRNSAWQTKASFNVFENGKELIRIFPGFVYPGSDMVLIGQGGGVGIEVHAHFELELKDL